MYLSNLIKQLQNALDTCGDTKDISVDGKEVIFIDFEKDKYKEHTKVEIFTK